MSFSGPRFVLLAVGLSLLVVGVFFMASANVYNGGVPFLYGLPMTIGGAICLAAAVAIKF